MMKPNANITLQLMAKARDLNSRRFTIGCAVVSSRITSAMSATPEMTVNEQMKFDENPSSRSNLSSTICRQPKPDRHEEETQVVDSQAFIEQRTPFLLHQLAVAHEHPRQHQRHYANRQVDQEHPVPRIVLGDPAARASVR